MSLTVKNIRTLLSTFTARKRLSDIAFKFHFGHNGREHVYTGPRIGYERYGAAQGACRDAWLALSDLLLAAEWGPHDHGRVFVQRRSGWPQDQHTTVIISIDGIPVLSGREENRDEIHGLKIHDEEAERAARGARRAKARAAELARDELRDRIAANLRRGRVPRGVVAHDGQRGGYLVVGETTLAIRGVLKAAGIDPGDHPFATWTAALADLTTTEPGARVRARDLPPKVRHLRAEHLTA